MLSAFKVIRKTHSAESSYENQLCVIFSLQNQQINARFLIYEFKVNNILGFLIDNSAKATGY